MTESVTVAPSVVIEVDVDRTRVGLRVVRGLGWALIWLGALTLGFVAHQLWVTTWLAELNQGALDVEREAHFATAVISEVEYIPTIIDTTSTTVVVPGVAGTLPVDPGSSSTIGQGALSDIPDPIRQTPLVLKVESAPEAHDSFALIRIPKLDRLAEGWNVVEGVKRGDLKTGAGHMPWTPLPGQPGNSVISGHRTTYGAPFHELDELEPGDIIEVDTALGTHVYEVRETIIVKPTALWVTEPREGAWLTLTTCHPRFSARQRLVVFAEMVAGPNAEVILATS